MSQLSPSAFSFHEESVPAAATGWDACVLDERCVEPAYRPGKRPHSQKESLQVSASSGEMQVRPQNCTVAAGLFTGERREKGRCSLFRGRNVQQDVRLKFENRYSDSALSQTPCHGWRRLNPHKQKNQLDSDPGGRGDGGPRADGQPGSSPLTPGRDDVSPSSKLHLQEQDKRKPDFCRAESALCTALSLSPCINPGGKFPQPGRLCRTLTDTDAFTLKTPMCLKSSCCFLFVHFYQRKAWSTGLLQETPFGETYDEIMNG